METPQPKTQTGSTIETFGNMVFNDAVMQQRLPKPIYRALKKTMTQGKHLELEVANIVANAMMQWAIEKGATHFSHWFQPMTGSTAEKHDSFVERSGDSSAISSFSGKSLVRGESDASSFPSGGLRATFEARGYTVWDTTSYAFVKGGTLYIPTAFCSYSGEALDKKTPLLRSMQAVDKQAQRILKLFGNTGVKHVTAVVGPEQEYFLIDKEYFKKRPDLVYTGRTLFGAKPPKGQELEDHYFGCIKPRVAAFMAELDEELWKLGVYAKTKHNETAPSQHELAPIYTTASIATDNNQLTMELMKVLADKHGFACLLHEKPFKGINGSGKHNNWSLCTDTGANLLEPGKTPRENAQFLLFLVAVIKAVDEYQDLLRVSTASAGNDHRLGANEAPPAIISMFLGEQLTAIMESIIQGSDYQDVTKPAMEIGVTVLPHFPQDTTDRNRTSPFAFTGNKFEFRMVGSAMSVAEPNIVLNTIVAEELACFADILEASADFKADLAKLIKDTFTAHKRIVFNGNNYSKEWVEKAEKLGLSNLKTTADALPELISKKNVEMFARHGVFTETELRSRFEIQMEAYCKTLGIEALTMADIVKRGIIPACIDYQNDLMRLVNQKRKHPYINKSLEESMLAEVSKLSGDLLNKLNELEDVLSELSDTKELYDLTVQAALYRDKVIVSMDALREAADELETLVAQKYWPLPSYGELLYSVI